MASSGTVREDQTGLSYLDRTYHKLERVLTIVGGVAILLLVFLAVRNILGRWLFNAPIDGYIDWVEQAMAFIAFGGLAYTQRLGGHIRMDIVVGLLKGRVLWCVELITTSIMFLLTLLLVYGSWLHFGRAFDFNSSLWSRDSSIDIDLPTWPAKLIVPIALSLLCLRLMLQMWGYCRAIYQNSEIPVAVPLVEDAAAAAMREAETVSSSIIDVEEPINKEVK